MFTILADGKAPEMALAMASLNSDWLNWEAVGSSDIKDDFQSVLCSLSPHCLCASLEECKECSYRTNKMADASVPSAGLSSVAENWRFLSNEEKEKWRKTLCARRDSSRINLLDSFERWHNLGDDLGLSKDKDLARFLMDFYESAQEKNRSR